MRSTRLIRRAAGIAVLPLLLAAPAFAHPYFHGGEAPADSLATLTLDLAHGCGDEADGGSDTVEVAMQVPDAVTFVEPHDKAGWIVEVERDADGRAEVVTWEADGGATPAPTFDLDVVVGGNPGDEVWFGVFQGCVEGSARWVGTPDAPADDPGVRLTLTAPDPDRPPPPAAAASPTPPATGEATAQAPTAPAATPAPTPQDADPDDLAAGVEAGRFPWLPTLALLVVVAGIGVAVTRRRGGSRA